jgi:hypothetical protein
MSALEDTGVVGCDGLLDEVVDVDVDAELWTDLLEVELDGLYSEGKRRCQSLSYSSLRVSGTSQLSK